MRPWYLGNTTVRSPFRLREGLVALSTSSIQGNLRGRDQEIALRNLLGEHGIVELGDDVSYSVGRKWRSALNKLGFLYPEIPSNSGVAQGDVGPVDTITPNGWRLIRAESVPAMQECFLRALAAYYIPSPLEAYPFARFSPLRHTLAVMLELERGNGDSRLNFIEMALVVQLSSNDDGVAEVARRVLDIRQRRDQAQNKRAFDNQERDAAAALHQYVAATFNDYADTNFRYVKATGLVQSKGRGITLVPEKHVLIERFVADATVPASDQAYFATLANGASLPTDNRDEAVIVLYDLIDQLRRRGIAFAVGQRPLATPADIAILRHQAEELLSERNEEEFADRQASKWEEIAAYMGLISSRSRKKILVAGGEEISVPQSEAPAYFEWVLWRAFLAINSLTNKPYEARRFKIDQDFLPIGTAPGNGPDLIFEFQNYVLVVEVTLTDNSRQEAAEGEPVRRHVAELLTDHRTRTGKPVYGLFIANRIDSNTAETFRIGVWYDREDAKMRLDILPFTLEQFKALFVALFQNQRVDVQTVRDLLDRCSNIRPQHEAPAWKQQIGVIIQQHVQELSLPRVQ
jgi:hypothetical protein